ncbi:AF4/FMR2 family member 3 isoform X2 [Pyxicephalus adspersus]|uniref:AF4/FMR2 family member 3 isoform X2 n=1 Tax=Pyxicephalus adspersus TaxID=30357 RepID=UPI003B5C49C2
MDSLDFALLQEWDLDDLCGYEQDKSVLRRKEWEKRSQEVQPSEDIFLVNYPLFSEPYKTSKGDELSTRIQSTLGSYDEMKELLTERSHQSQFVGIPKTDPANTPLRKTEDQLPQNSTESHYLVCQTVQTSITSSATPVQLNNKANMNWQLTGYSLEGQKGGSKADQRKANSANSNSKCGHQKHINDKSKNYMLSPESTSGNDYQHNLLTCGFDKPLSRTITHSKLNCNIDLDSQIKEKHCSQNTNSLNSLQTFPASIVSKLNPVQQKPTAYVRPMDGQDQAPNESPKLKSQNELSTVLPRGLSNKADSDKLQEEKVETFSDLSQDEDNNHSGMGFCSPNGDLKIRSQANCSAQISMLEDDLKLSSDEDDCQQLATEGQAVGVQSDSAVSGDPQKGSGLASGISIKGSGSNSSESDTTSESDSETESSSSESESSTPSSPSACTSPEPEQATSNKWQLDKWLNKVNPNKNTILNHAQSLNLNGVHENKASSTEASKSCHPSPNHKNGGSPNREDHSLGAVCAVHGSKSVKLHTSPCAATIVVGVPTESTSSRRPVCRQLTRRTERTSSADHLNCRKLNETSVSKGISENEIQEQAKNRLTCNSKGLHRKEPRTGVFSCEQRRTRITRSAPKSKEVTEFSIQHSELNTETEVDVSQLPKTFSASPSENNHRIKESGRNNSTCGNTYSSHNVGNTRTGNNIAAETEEQFYKLVPFGRNDNVCSLKGIGEIKSLWVRIDINLLTRIPLNISQEHYNLICNTDKTFMASQNKDLPPAIHNTGLKMRRKRKFECEQSQDTKKKHVENRERLQFPLGSYDVTSSSDSTNLSSIAGLYEIRNGNRLLPLPCLSDESSKTLNDGCSSATKCDRNGLTRPESRLHVEQSSLPVPSASNITVGYKEDFQSDMWSSGLYGHKETRKAKQSLDSIPHSADYFMQEAKRMKHKADAMMDKFDKVLNYTEAALSFIECGNAMEHGPMESKSPYTMYSETVELIRYALRLKSHSGHSGSTLDKKITALCYRCLALLYWRMFRLKRDHAVKYSKALIEYFKNSSKTSRISSPGNTKEKTTMTSSPISPSPLVNSVVSNSSSSTSIISIPQRIHQMAANHVSITNSILHSYDYWEIADNLTKDNTEFFKELDALLGPITLHSSMEHLVQYTRQGLSWIRQSSHHVL